MHALSDYYYIIVTLVIKHYDNGNDDGADARDTPQIRNDNAIMLKKLS